LFHCSTYKLTYGVTSYVNSVDIDRFRRCLAIFSDSSHELMIEQGRHYGLHEDYRTCTYCEGSIEDQIHFISICPLYKE